MNAILAFALTVSVSLALTSAALASMTPCTLATAVLAPAMPGAEPSLDYRLEKRFVIDLVEHKVILIGLKRLTQRNTHRSCEPTLLPNFQSRCCATGGGTFCVCNPRSSS